MTGKRKPKQIKVSSFRLAVVTVIVGAYHALIDSPSWTSWQAILSIAGGLAGIVLLVVPLSSEWIWNKLRGHRRSEVRRTLAVIDDVLQELDAGKRPVGDILYLEDRLKLHGVNLQLPDRFDDQHFIDALRHIRRHLEDRNFPAAASAADRANKVLQQARSTEVVPEKRTGC